MAKNEANAFLNAIPLAIPDLNKFVDEMDGILDDRTYGIAGVELNAIRREMAERIKYQLDASGRARKAEASLDEALAHFADLKERLHNAEVDNAVMRGYLDRVAEDDHATDGFFEVADGNGEVSARPKRKAYGYRTMGSQVGGSVGYALSGADTEPNRPTKRRVHWTSY